MTTRSTLATLVLLTAFGAVGCIEDAWAQHTPDARAPADTGPTPSAGRDAGSGGPGSTGLHGNPSAPGLTNQRFEEVTGVGPDQLPRVHLALTRVALRVRACLLAEHFASTLDVGVHFNLNAAPRAGAVVVDTGHPIAHRCLTTGIRAESFPTATPLVPVSARFRINYGAPR